MGRVDIVLSALEKLTTFLEPFLPILNSHMVAFLTEKEWDKIDKAVQCELIQLNHQQLAALPGDFLNIDSKELSHIGPSIRNLMKSIHQHSLASLCALSDLNSVWKQLQVEPLTSMINFDQYMKVIVSNHVKVVILIAFWKFSAQKNSWSECPVWCDSQSGQAH